MKTKIKLLFAATILFLASLSSQNLEGQARERKTISGGSGLCCQTALEECDHPNGMTFDNAKWKAGLEFCP